MIKKEVSPIPNTPKTIPKKISYKYVGKESLSQAIDKAIPEQLIPTKRIGTIFGAIFILVLILAAFQFPLSSLMSGNIEITIKVGFPMTFLELALQESDVSPIKPIGFIVDLLLYILLAYAIDISINLILNNPLLRSEKKAKQKPTIFKDKKPTTVEKVAEKITEQVTKEKIPKA